MPTRSKKAFITFSATSFILTTGLIGIATRQSPKLISISLKGTDILAVGHYGAVIAICNYKGSRKTKCPEITDWNSTNSNVVAVDGGRLLANHSGVATITAEVDGIVSLPFEVDAVSP